MDRGDKRYIWELPDWPHWRYDLGRLVGPLAGVHRAQGHLLGRMRDLGFGESDRATLSMLTEEVLNTSQIEEELLDPETVRSSIARRLGIDIGALAPTDRHVEGVVEMVLDATGNSGKSLTAERLFAWQAGLFHTGYNSLGKVRTGNWRDDAVGPMQVVSGPEGRRRVHYEAPPAPSLEQEMSDFLSWFNEHEGIDPVLKSGLAQLWFVTIHPFDDGNGRIARAICDLVLARSEQTAQRFYSFSAQIQRERKDYYDQLERVQKGTLDVTSWLEWFLGCLLRAIQGAEAALAGVLAKSRFWQHRAGTSFNDRQIKLINLLLDGFHGNLTSGKWAKIAKCSPDTALRDITDLIARNVLMKSDAGGRSTHYIMKSFD